MVATGAVLLRARRAQVDAALSGRSWWRLPASSAQSSASPRVTTPMGSSSSAHPEAGSIQRPAAGVVMKGLKQPFDSIFAKLQASAVRDPPDGGVQQARLPPGGAA